MLQVGAHLDRHIEQRMTQGVVEVGGDEEGHRRMTSTVAAEDTLLNDWTKEVGGTLEAEVAYPIPAHCLCAAVGGGSTWGVEGLVGEGLVAVEALDHPYSSWQSLHTHIQHCLLAMEGGRRVVVGTTVHGAADDVVGKRWGAAVLNEDDLGATGVLQNLQRADDLQERAEGQEAGVAVLVPKEEDQEAKGAAAAALKGEEVGEGHQEAQGVEEGECPSPCRHHRRKRRRRRRIPPRSPKSHPTRCLIHFWNQQIPFPHPFSWEQGWLGELKNLATVGGR